MLNKHQLLHLNAVMSEAKELQLSKKRRDIELVAKEIKSTKHMDYLTDILTKVEDIKSSGVFPCKYPSDIHDYLEEEDIKLEYKI